MSRVMFLAHVAVTCCVAGMMWFIHEQAHQRLVKTNWIRTACYTGRIVLMLAMVDRAMGG